MNRHLEGGCQVPIGSYAILNATDSNQLWLRGLVGSPDGKLILQAEAYGEKQNPEALGVAVAEQLLEQGAQKILQDVYG